MSTSQDNLGTVLVFGGGGFLGTVVVEQLLETNSWSSVAVASRNPQHAFPNVSYHSVDIRDEASVKSLLQTIKPRLVIHLVSPQYKSEPKVLYDCNVTGTEMFLRCCTESPTVETLLFTSTNRVIANEPPGTLTEDQIILFNASSKVHPYCKTKAQADRMVLDANSASLKTAVLRVPIVYGSSGQHMDIVMDMLSKGQQKIQLGDDKAVFEVVGVDNAAHAHVLAARELLNPASQIAGQAFSITDGSPMTWYAFARKVWAEAGDKTTPEEVRVVPFWFLMTAASVWEWAVWLGSLGRARATEFNRSNIRTLQEGNCVLDISKAKKLLGYSIVVPMEEGIKKATQRALKERAETGV